MKKPNIINRPPMGFSTWNAYRGNIDEKLIMDVVEAMEKDGLKDAGYRYVNLDDCWMSTERDAGGNLQGDYSTFPHGMKYLADFIHSRGFKFGLYASNGTYTCEDYPSCLGHEYQDARQFEKWDVDYFKYDFCHNIELKHLAPKVQKLTFFDKRTDRILEHLSSDPNNILTGEAVIINGMADNLSENRGKLIIPVEIEAEGEFVINVYYETPVNTETLLFVKVNDAEPVHCPLPAKAWRPSGRYQFKANLKKGRNTVEVYNPVATKEDSAKYLYRKMADALYKTGRDIIYSVCEWGANKPYLWAGEFAHLWRTSGDIFPHWENVMKNYDAVIDLSQYAGPGRYNDPDILEVGNGDLTEQECITHFSLWCMLASPLLVSYDVRVHRPDILKIILNKDAIAIDQDSLSKQAHRVYNKDGLEMLVKPLENGDYALLYFNRSEERKMIPDALPEYLLGYKTYFDVWTKTTGKPEAIALLPHEVKMYRVSK